MFCWKIPEFKLSNLFNLNTISAFFILSTNLKRRYKSRSDSRKYIILPHISIILICYQILYIFFSHLALYSRINSAFSFWHSTQKALARLIQSDRPEKLFVLTHSHKSTIDQKSAWVVRVNSETLDSPNHRFAAIISI